MESNGEKGAESLQKKVEESWQKTVKKAEDQWKRSVEHAKTYPYVWASYAVVWGGLSIYTIYEVRKLRKMEDRVRAIQHKLKQLADAEQEAAVLKKQQFEQMKSAAANKNGSRVAQAGK